jgi:hypothetical protein
MRSFILLVLVSVLTACGGGGGGGSSPASTPVASSPVQAMTYQNADSVGQVFGTQVADLNGDGLEDVVVSGWAVEPAGYSSALHGKVPVRILIQQSNGTLQDQTDALLGAGNNMIWGSQRIIIADFDNDNKLDIFLGGFQDSPALSGNGNCCTPTTSVMFWNNGSNFTRYDFTDTVWAHAVCIGDLYSNGRQDIVMGGSGVYANNIYVNNGSRNFTLTHTNQFISSGGACAVVKDAATGNVGIVTTNIAYAMIAGYNAAIQLFDSNMTFTGHIGLVGAEGNGHDIVNIIQTDLNNDGLEDLVLTDNKTDNNDGAFTVLINSGNMTYTNQTATYFPNQTNNYYFQYYTRLMDVNGAKSIFVDNVSSNWTFNNMPQLWSLGTSFQTALQSQLSTAIGSYKQPTLYKTSTGYSVLMYQGNGSGYTFYTKPL